MLMANLLLRSSGATQRALVHSCGDVTLTEDEQAAAIRITRKWIEEHVVRLNLCALRA